MKKSLLALCALVYCALPSAAQISKGGLPQSVQSELTYTNIPVSAYANPDWEAHLQTEKEYTNSSRPFSVGLYAAADFGFPQSGQLVHLANGQRVWRGKIAVSGAPAIALLYDKFRLPKGVKLFLINENRQQVLGAFDADNNDASGTFVTDVVQGSTVTVELNIGSQVSLEEIQLHIDRAAVMHRAIEHLRTYAGTDIPLADQYDSMYNGQSSTCMINAICPQGSNYSNSRKATIQLLFFQNQDVASCSGTLVTNTGNSPTNCKPYILTASHCEFSYAMSNAPFNQVITRFNFEHSACTGSPNPSAQSMTGLDLLARSSQGNNGDFMLLALRAAIPAGYGAVLSGWNNNANIPTTVSEPKRFIGFHHPNGDNKKVSYGNTINPYFNIQMQQMGWILPFQEGYVYSGSSGSGLFDGDGYLIGDLSGAGSTSSDTCTRNAAGQQIPDPDNEANYFGFAFAWDYSIDGTDSNRKLKPWLDPAGTNAVTIGPASSSCAAIGSTSINTADEELSNSISIFPNPSKDGWVTVQYNLKSALDMAITITDLTGKVVLESKKSRVEKELTRLNVSTLASGMYILKFTSTGGFATKKLMIQK